MNKKSPEKEYNRYNTSIYGMKMIMKTTRYTQNHKRIVEYE